MKKCTVNLLRLSVFWIGLAITFPGIVQANPGEFDTTFDGDGKQTMAIGSEAGVLGIQQQADGKLIVAGFGTTSTAGDFLVARYLANGSLDTSFSSDGYALTDIAGQYDRGHDLVLQPDGKIVVAGQAGGNRAALVRYHPNGSLDSSFGAGGKVHQAIGPVCCDENVQSIALLPSGKLLVAGSASNGADVDIAVARFNPDGTFDTSFDNDGKLLTAVGAGRDDGFDLLVEPGGKFLVSGYTRNTYDYPLVIRYNSDGSLDTTFSGDGIFTTLGAGNQKGIANAIVRHDDGSYTVGGVINANFMLMHLTASGTLDTGFGTGGTVITPVSTQIQIVNDLVMQIDGKFVLFGSAIVGSGTGSFWDMAVVRYLPDGALDTTFDTDGMLTLGVYAPGVGAGSDSGYAVIQQFDGKLVLGGISSGRMALVRMLATDIAGPDADGDGVLLPLDNCPNVINVTQLDADGDTLGNVCDDDDDNDGVFDVFDELPFDPAESFDTDHDGIGNNADPDDDNDGLPDVMDPLPLQSKFNLNAPYKGSRVQDQSAVE